MRGNIYCYTLPTLEFRQTEFERTTRSPQFIGIVLPAAQPKKLVQTAMGIKIENFISFLYTRIALVRQSFSAGLDDGGAMR